VYDSIRLMDPMTELIRILAALLFAAAAACTTTTPDIVYWTPTAQATAEIATSAPETSDERQCAATNDLDARAHHFTGVGRAYTGLAGSASRLTVAYAYTGWPACAHNA
jgi:hypothetical protein